MELGQSQRVALRIGGVIVACTILLTGSFVGFLAAIAGELPMQDFNARVPWYLVAGAVVFVGTIILLEINDADGRTIIVTAAVFGTLAFLLVSLGIEGYIYTFENPEDVVVSRLILYFLSASLVAAGVGYWGLRHWREFTAQQPESL